MILGDLGCLQICTITVICLEALKDGHNVREELEPVDPYRECAAREVAI